MNVVVYISYTVHTVSILRLHYVSVLSLFMGLYPLGKSIPYILHYYTLCL